MYKKMLSMTVALMLILSVFAAMPVMADFGAVGFEADMDGEEYAVGDITTTTYNDWDLGNSGYFAESIVSVPGYDGKMTKVFKVSGLASTGTSDGSAREKFRGADFSGFSYGQKTYETFDIYYDKTNFLYPASGKYISIGGLRFGTVFEKNSEGVNVPAGVMVMLRRTKNSNPDYAYLKEGWNRIEIVRDFPFGTAPSVDVTGSGKATLWLNGELCNETNYGIAYRVEAPYGYVDSMFQFSGSAYGGSYATSQYVYIDNVKVACAPAATTVSSEMNGATGVLRDTNEITLNFSDRVLEDVTKSDVVQHNVVPADFVVSGGVQVSNVAVAADRKSVTLTLDRELEYETTYEVSIAENALMDMYSNYITGSVSFTTEERPAYTPTKPVFKKEYLFTGGEGKVLKKLENGYVSCQYSLTNNTAEEKNALMFVVLWENGQIKGFMFNPQVMAANGGVANLYGGFNVADANNTKIEAYAWEGFLSMSPLMPKFTINKDGIAGTGVIEE